MTIPPIDTPARAIDAALTQLIVGDVAVGGLVTLMPPVPKVYSLRAPQNIAPPYIVLGSTGEGDFSTFGQHGSDDSLDLHIWTPNPEDKYAGLFIYGRLRQLLHKKKLTLVGHRGLSGELTLIGQFIDEDDETMHTVASYRVLSYFIPA